MTGALLNLISFVWFPYHFDSCLNYVYTLCEQGLLTEAACARAGCVWPRLGFAEVFGLCFLFFFFSFWDFCLMMEKRRRKAVVAGAKDDGGAAVPAGLRLRRLGRGGVRRVNLAVFFAINLLFPYAAAFLVRPINLGSGLHRGTRSSPAASGRIPNDSLKGAWKQPHLHGDRAVARERLIIHAVVGERRARADFSSRGLGNCWRRARERVLSTRLFANAIRWGWSGPAETRCRAWYPKRARGMREP